MLAVEIIAAKQQGNELSSEQIRWVVREFSQGKLPDYQMAALLMACYFQKLDEREGRDFLSAMVDSGVRLDLSSVPGIKVDKHSTGGVGDKTSLIIAPVVAAAGVPVPMISGRALGHTGGTLDKLESIAGFRVRLSHEEFESVLAKTGCAFGAQTDELVPADRKLYALRDVTSTVSIPPLIAASILSKKIAEGTNALVMDIKIGGGGFIGDESTARDLAQMIVRWANSEGVRTLAFGTDMTEPLGKAAGNGPEVAEALDVLGTGKGDPRLIAVCRELGGAMLWLGGTAADRAAGEELFDQVLASGAGFEKFVEIATAQGAKPEVLQDFKRTVAPAFRKEIVAEEAGHITEIDPREIGIALIGLGAGRVVSDDPVDPTSGIVFVKQRGEFVSRGEPIAHAMWSKQSDVEEAIARIRRAIRIGAPPPPQRELFRFCCDENGISEYTQGKQNG